MDSTRAREARYVEAIQNAYDRLTVDEDYKIARAAMAVADAERAEVEIITCSHGAASSDRTHSCAEAERHNAH